MTHHFVGLSQLSSIKTSCFCDLMVQIIGCYSANVDDVILRVWDGSRLSKRIDRDDMPIVDSLDQEKQNDLKGYFVDVFIHDEHKNTAKKLLADEFVLMKNVHVHRPATDTFKTDILVMHGGSRMGRGFHPCPPQCGLFKRMVSACPTKLKLLRAERLAREAEEQPLVLYDSRDESSFNRATVDEARNQHDFVVDVPGLGQVLIRTDSDVTLTIIDETGTDHRVADSETQ